MMRGMATPVPLGDRIRKRRQQLRLTQEEMARRVGVHPSTVLNWEKGKHFPSRYQGAVEEVLGVSLDAEPEPERPAISPHTRMLLRRELSEEDYERVMALLERRDRALPRPAPAPSP